MWTVAPDGEIDDCAGVVCFGGPGPGTPGLRSTLSRAHSEGRAILAVGSGAAALTEALGGRVRPGRPEVGPTLAAKRDSAAGDPLFHEVPMTPDVIQFHQDEIIPPPGAVALVASPVAGVQAYRVGPRTYGLRFHIGVEWDAVTRWAADDPELAAHGRLQDFDERRLTDTARHIDEAWRPMTARFVALAAGKTAPAVPGRTLPLLS